MSDIASSSATASGSSNVKGAGSSTSSNGSGHSRFSLRGVLFSLAALIFVGSTFFAYTQDPRPDPFSPASTFDWFRYPLEYNAFRRLPVVTGTINAVFAVKRTTDVWAVGDRGLILHSSDGGKSWEQQNIGSPKPGASALLRSGVFEWTSPVWAQSQKPIGEQLKASETLQVDPKSSQSPAQQKQLPPGAPQGLGVDIQVSPSTSNPPANLGNLPVELKEPPKTEQRGPTSVRKSPQQKTPAIKSPEKSSGGITKSTPPSQSTVASPLNLYGLYFVDPLTGWAVGDDGTILHTTDGGKSWNPQARKSGNHLQSVAFVDAKTGWAVGFNGTILHTTDGGQSWNPQASNSAGRLQSVAFVDAKTGWAVGGGGTILHTTDGGQSWNPQPRKSGDLLREVAFIDAKTGWAVGEAGTILHTTDGGQSWNPQPSKIGSALRSVAFVDAKTGWAVGDGGIILQTTDEGQSWNPQASKSRGWLRSVAFVDAKTGWAVGEAGTILHTTDGGQSWNPQASNSAGRLQSVAFVEAKTGWAVGTFDTIHTTDGGKSWNPQATKSGNLLQSVAFVDAKTGWAVGFKGTIVHTTDGGQSWNPQASKSDGWLRSVAFVDAKTGWAVGEAGTILHTTDGGQSWNPQGSKSGSALRSVAFVDAKTGWAVGDGGTILHTTDGGQSWNPQASKSGGLLQSVAFVDAMTGWAAGNGGVILHTTDGGQSWNPQTSKSRGYLFSVAFVDAKTGWVVGADDTILHTTDGGQSWVSPHYRRYFAPWYYGSLAFVFIFLVPALRKPPPEQQSLPSIEAAMASDRPLRSGELDVLNLGQIAFALSRFLRNENTQPPLTIAITGDWGTGKSSLMNLLRDDLAAYGVRPVWFNAWHHQKEEHLLASLLNAVRAQAIPPFLTVAGLKFRVKLVWGRLRNNPVRSVILGAFFFIVAGYLLWDLPKRPLALWNLLSNLNIKGDNWSFDSLIKALLGSAALAPVYGLYKILQPFGVSPAVLLQNMSQGFTRRAAAEKTGFREEFARDFKEVSEALNPRTMLILIDDLDRCRPDAVLEVMEGINFLVSSGDCFVVMGMAREKVERAVGLSFKEIAKEQVGEHYREAKAEERENYERRQRWEYGKRYLEKLVNLWVQVPPLTPASGGTLLARATTQTRNTASVWRFVRDFLVAGVSVLVIGGLVYVGTMLPEVPPPPSSDTTQKTTPDTQAPPKSTGSPTPNIKPPLVSPTPEPEVTLGPVFVPGEKNSPGIWWGLAGLLVLIAAGSALVLVRPQLVVPDSKNFIDALKIWDDVITNVHNTPRTLKRFMNNLRWLAARTRKGHPPPTFTERIKANWQDMFGVNPADEPGNLPEPVLVGLASLEAIGFKSTPGDIRLFLISNKGPANGNAADAYEKHRAVALNNTSFENWPPTPAQIAQFFELMGDGNVSTIQASGNDDRAHAN